MKAIIILTVGIAWVMFINSLDEKRMEVYNDCVMVETINGDYECVK